MFLKQQLYIYNYIIFIFLYLNNFLFSQNDDLYELKCKDLQVGRVIDTNVTNPIHKGLNLIFYFESQPYHDQIPLDYLTGQILDDWRRNKFKEKLNQFLTDEANNLLWPVNNLKALAKSDSDLLINIAQKKSLLSRFILLYKHNAYFDCGEKTYNYSVSFLILKNPIMVFPEQVRMPIKDVVDSILEPKFTRLKNESSISVDLYDDLFCAIVKDTDLRKKVKTALSDAGEDLEILHYFDEGTRSLFNTLLNYKTITHFDSGKYILSGDLLFLVEMFVSRFLIMRNPNLNYKIISKGFADSNPINQAHGYIHYYGKANLNYKRNQEVVYSEETTCDCDLITSNDQLSIARGYAGAECINMILKNSLKNEELKNIQVFYAGGGAIPGKPQNIYRKIDLTIIK